MYQYVYRVLSSYVLDVHSHVWHMGLARPQALNKILLTYLLTYCESADSFQKGAINEAFCVYIYIYIYIVPLHGMHLIINIKIPMRRKISR